MLTTLSLLASGALIASLQLTGLWLTVRRLAGARRPAVLIVGSLTVRVALSTAAVFVLVHSVGGGGRHVLACLLGMISARWVIINRYAGVPAPRPAEDGHGT